MLNGGKWIKQMMNRVVHLLKNAGKSPISGLFRHHLSIFGRQYAKFLLKTLGEITGRTETRPFSDFIHGKLAFLKQGSCTIKADTADKCNRSSIGQSRQLFIKSVRSMQRSRASCSTPYSPSSKCCSTRART